MTMGAKSRWSVDDAREKAREKLASETRRTYASWRQERLENLSRVCELSAAKLLQVERGGVREDAGEQSSMIE